MKLFDVHTVVTRMWYRDDHPFRSGMVWDERTMNSCPLSIKKGNESCHIMFCLLRTLIGLRIRVRELMPLLFICLIYTKVLLCFLIVGLFKV